LSWFQIKGGSASIPNGKNIAGYENFLTRRGNIVADPYAPKVLLCKTLFHYPHPLTVDSAFLQSKKCAQM
jgi:hypothetical protein